MQFLSILKRAIPFALTLGIGLFIASFFVSVKTPTFEFKKNRSWSNHHECHKAKRSNREMRKEILNLRMELEAARLEVERLNGESRPTRVMPMKTIRVAPDAPVSRGSEFR